jgi:predicted RNA-binding protein with PUA-like domain
VDVAAVKDFARPVTLAEIKAEPSLKSMVLVRNSRLSVQPVASVEWKKVCAMGGETPRTLSAEKAPLR